MSPKYTLEAALTVRRVRTDTRTRELGVEAERVRAARIEVARLEAKLAGLTEARRAFDAEQRARLERGLERAADLARSAETRRAEEQHLRHCADELERAKVQLGAAQEAEQKAARALGSAFSEQRAVERHRETWDRARLAEQERAEDDQAMEAWKPERLDSLRR